MPPQDAYLESKILTADPLELVRMLYRAARDATRRAQTYLAAGGIAERSREISTALSILSELCASLDPARGGPLSHSLAELYDYMQRRLLEANLRQKPEPLAEVESLLVTLLEGWEQAQPVGEHSPAHPGGPLPEAHREMMAYAGYPALVMSAEPKSSSQSWSF